MLFVNTAMSSTMSGVKPFSTSVDILEILHFSEALSFIKFDDDQSLVHSDDELVGVGSESSDASRTDVLLVAEFVLSH